MAVTAPTPPTPPVPPSVPGVKLQEGGSVKESTVPQSGKQDHAARTESQARQSVADGNGALSKTTVSDGAKEEQPPAQSAAPPPMARQRAAAREEDGDAAMDAFAAREAGAKASIEAQDIPESPSYHGTAYWLFSISLLLVLAVALWRTVLRRRGQRPQTAKGEPLPAQEAAAAAEPPVPRGTKVGEALRAMEAREAAKSYAARAAEARQEPRREAPRPARKAAPAAQAGNAPEEREHFEVRI